MPPPLSVGRSHGPVLHQRCRIRIRPTGRSRLRCGEWTAASLCHGWGRPLRVVMGQRDGKYDYAAPLRLRVLQLGLLVGHSVEIMHDRRVCSVRDRLAGKAEGVLSSTNRLFVLVVGHEQV